LAHRFSRRLFESGVFAQSLSFPTVPQGKARLRTIVTATHRKKDLERAMSIMELVGRELKII